MQLADAFKQLWNQGWKVAVWSDMVRFFKFESKNQSVPNWRPTMMLWQDGYTLTKKQQWRSESAAIQVSSQNSVSALNSSRFSFLPCQSKHSHNSQGKPEASAQQEDIKTCQIMGNMNTQPDLCLCLLRAIQQKQQISGLHVASSKNRT